MKNDKNFEDILDCLKEMHEMFPNDTVPNLIKTAINYGDASGFGNVWNNNDSTLTALKRYLKHKRG